MSTALISHDRRGFYSSDKQVLYFRTLPVFVMYNDTCSIAKLYCNETANRDFEGIGSNDGRDGLEGVLRIPPGVKKLAAP